MIPERHDRSGDPQGLLGSFAYLFLDGIEFTKKGSDEVEEFGASREEFEGPPPEELHSQAGLELEQLAADGGLLDPIGHIAHRFHDAAVSRDIVEELQMVDIHVGEKTMLPIAGQ
jgi:hypothetical protein